jgi:hypothetical protein
MSGETGNQSAVDALIKLKRFSTKSPNHSPMAFRSVLATKPRQDLLVTLETLGLLTCTAAEADQLLMAPPSADQPAWSTCPQAVTGPTGPYPPEPWFKARAPRVD